MYHVLVDVKKKRKIFQKTLVDLSKETLFERVVFPYFNKESILINSIMIKYSEIDKITIIETQSSYQTIVNDDACKIKTDGLVDCLSFYDIKELPDTKTVTSDIFFEARKLVYKKLKIE